MNDERAQRGAVRPVYDYQRALGRLGGDPTLFREVAALFLEDSPHLLEAARRGLNARDPGMVERAAHSLKSLSATFDAEALNGAAASLEHHAHEGDLERAAAYFAEMESELARLRAALANGGPDGGRPAS